MNLDRVKKVIESPTNSEADRKNRLDLLNWAKSELRQETYPKLGKIMIAGRKDRITFLQDTIKQLKMKMNAE
jgi:hypothetical protein